MKNFRMSPYSFSSNSGQVIQFPLHRAAHPQDTYVYAPPLPRLVRQTAPSFPRFYGINPLLYPLRVLLGMPARILTGSGLGLFRLLALLIAGIVIFNPSVIANSPYRGMILGGALGGACLAVLSSVSRCFGNVLNCLFWIGIATVVGREWQGSSAVPDSTPNVSQSVAMQPVMANPQDWVDLSGRPLQMLKDIESSLSRAVPQQGAVAAASARNSSFGSQPLFESFFDSASSSLKSGANSIGLGGLTGMGRSGGRQSPDIKISGSVLPDDAYFAPAYVSQVQVGQSPASNSIESMVSALPLPAGISKLLKPR